MAIAQLSTRRWLAVVAAGCGLALLALVQPLAALALPLALLMQRFGQALFLLGHGRGRAAFWPGMLTLTASPPLTPAERAWAAYGGPLVGGLLAAACGYGYALGGSEPLWYLALIGLGLSLVSLLPLRPLPGAAIAALLDRRIWWLGLALGAVLLLLRPHLMSALLVLLAGFQLYYRRPGGERPCAACGRRNRIGRGGAGAVARCGHCRFALTLGRPQASRLGVAYFGLLLFLALAFVAVAAY